GRESRAAPEADQQRFEEWLWCGLFTGRKGNTPRLSATEESRCAALRAGPPLRLTLVSHLSTEGFLLPVAHANAALHDRLAAAGSLKAAARRELGDRFWQAFFADSRFTIDQDGAEENEARGLHELKPGAIEIVPRAQLQGGEALSALSGSPAGPSLRNQLLRNHLVIAPRAARLVFRLPDPTFRPLTSVVLPDGLAALFQPATAPPAFEPLLKAHPYYGVRTFSFTVNESLHLLHQHQATSGRARLALVLPGGGVKAAYQSRLLEELYGEGYLENALTHSGRNPPPLKVDHVIGTSGGALLGYFVARLAENGPFKLSDILWHPPDSGAVKSTDIFGWTDLPRYLSVITIFLVLAGILALLSIPVGAPLAPLPVQHEGAWRLRLALTIGPLLLLAPLLVRQVNGELSREHIPELEGLLYAVCASLAMLADQCLVFDRQPRPAGPFPFRHPGPPLAAGAALIAVPLLLEARGQDLSSPAGFGLAFAVLALLALGGALILPVRVMARPTVRLAPRLAAAALDLLLAGFVSLFLLFLPPALWQVLGLLPFFLVGFLLICLLLGFHHFVLGPIQGQPRIAPWATYYGTLLASCVLLLALCRPEQTGLAAGMSMLRQPSQLAISVGSLLVCMGVLCSLVGALLWAYGSQPRYHLREVRGFAAGFLLGMLQIVIVYAVLLAVIALWPERLSPLELTGQFWLWLLPVSLGVGLILVLAGHFGPARLAPCRFLAEGLRFLCSRHPNASLLTRRFARLAVLSCFAFLWWNFVVAPALYGNRHATHYLDRALQSFAAAYCQANCASGKTDPNRLTAQFLAPANALEVDGTRYFLVVPAEQPDCPALSPRRGSGASWYRFHLRPARRCPQGRCGGTGVTPQAVAGCGGLREEDPSFVEKVIFASGSPFPIFPAHLVPLGDPRLGKPERQALVDGGYSNDVPVDAALTLAAEQVLIVQSSNPLGHVSSGGGRFAALWQRLPRLAGPLVADLGRLPGFLFERSQQVDRLSRNDLFVISLSPLREEADWPLLFDFRTGTVDR
ncbi:MAG TPA: patatin-like phospholipase family protein, partial [Thermoanaerobaculia bacterium]|nr:patatin-like phospholipase family protein [Thermoanaerobaculia bacterium]